MPRPRSVEAHKKVIKATIKLIAERGIDATSMDAIAERSGVSKATIYNHWPDKEGLLLEVMADLHGLRNRPAFNSGCTKADLIAVLAYQPDKKTADLQERIRPDFMAFASRNPKFGQAWRDMVMDPPRKELARLLDQGIERGELLREPDRPIALAMLLGPMIYFHIFLRSQPHFVKEVPEVVVDAFWRAFGTHANSDVPKPD